jgi:hypothetical protein
MSTTWNSFSKKINYTNLPDFRNSLQSKPTSFSKNKNQILNFRTTRNNWREATPKALDLFTKMNLITTIRSPVHSKDNQKIPKTIKSSTVSTLLKK